MPSANFTATGRVGDGLATVTFTDASVGSIISRKWILGDGTVIDGNLTSVSHTYVAPGTYTVILVVEDFASQYTEIKSDYVVVNEIHPRPSFVIAEGLGLSDDEYWCFKLDSMLRLVYEDKAFVHRSVDPVTTIGKWTLLEFHAGANEMYAGTYTQVRRSVGVAKSVNSSPPVLSSNEFKVAPNSTLKIDELKIWLGEKRLKDYYYENRGASS